MLSAKRLNVLKNCLKSSVFARKISQKCMEISEEVREALHNNKPIVALESTIITHGMPYPTNQQCAEDVEEIIRQQGALPATIAIFGGQIKVGLSKNEIAHLSDIRRNPAIKVSRRDFSYAIANSLNGGTTVAGTLIVAKSVGISVFATGGIGGVHREAENSFDISADLLELGKSPVAVVSSGVKSILDIPKTLEYLETQGVFVATFGDSKQFPAFYSRSSGCTSPYNVPDAKEAAEIIRSHLELGLRSGLLFAVPVPPEFALDETEINSFIRQALNNARDKGIRGKQITPYLLEQIADLTKGSSLITNVALIKNNAKVAADIAVNLAKSRVSTPPSIKRNPSSVFKKMDTETIGPVVIGGSIVDCCATIKDPEIRLDGRIHEAKFRISGGGVGRNIAEALCKLGCNPTFISAVGDDNHGQFLRTLLPPHCSRGMKIVPNGATAQCVVVFDCNGECIFLLGDTDIFQEITPEMIDEQEEIIKKTPLIVLDGNLPLSTTQRVLDIAEHHKVPVFFEPTDVPMSIKPFKTSSWKAIKYISPNLNELKQIATVFNVPISTKKFSGQIEEAQFLARSLTEYLPNIFVTLGKDGVLVVNAEGKSVKLYKAPLINDIKNVSGAGDCLASGIIASMLNNLSEENAISAGFAAAKASLLSESAVPTVLFDKNHDAWKLPAAYTAL